MITLITKNHFVSTATTNVLLFFSISSWPGSVGGSQVSFVI